MATTYITQTTSDTQFNLTTDDWVTQTFTPSSTFRTYTLKLKVSSDISKKFVCLFYATSGGLPTGNQLADAIFTVDTGGIETWHEKTILPMVVFESGVKYALVIYMNTPGPDNYVSYNSAGGLANGNMLTSDNSGSSWTSTSNDIAFEITGNTPEPVAPSSPTPVDDATFIPVGVILSFATSPFTDTVDVYFNKTSYNASPVIKVVDNQDVNIYQPPSDLDLSVEYVWKVVARNDYGTADSSDWSFTTGSPVVITNATELQAMKDSPASNYILANDIDLEGESWTPVGNLSDGSFSGSFDGAGYTISNLNIPGSSDYQGLFGIVVTGGYIHDLILEDVNVSGDDNVGGFVGYIGGATIQDCSVSGTVTGGTTSDYIGGFVGYISSSGADIDNCISTVTVNTAGASSEAGGFVGFMGAGTIDKSYSTGDVNCTGAGSVQAGGFVGLFVGTIQNCYATGDVTTAGGFVAGFVSRISGAGSSVINCYSVGAVSGGTAKGLNNNNAGTITSSYYDSDTSGLSDTGSGTPQTTKEMKQELTFTDWDYASPVWYIIERITYPTFTFQGAVGGARPAYYNPAANWVYADGSYKWDEVYASGGGRYNEQLVVVGHKTVYFGSL